MVMANIAAVVVGATMVVPAEHFDPLATLTAVANEKCDSPVWRTNEVPRRT